MRQYRFLGKTGTWAALGVAVSAMVATVGAVASGPALAKGGGPHTTVVTTSPTTPQNAHLVTASTTLGPTGKFVFINLA